MKKAIDWLQEVGEVVGQDMFIPSNPPGHRVETLIEKIQKDARKEDEELWEWIRKNLGNIDFNVKVPINIWSTNPWLATGLTFKDALTKARIELAEALK